MLVLLFVLAVLGALVPAAVLLVRVRRRRRLSDVGKIVTITAGATTMRARIVSVSSPSSIQLSSVSSTQVRSVRCPWLFPRWRRIARCR